MPDVAPDRYIRLPGRGNSRKGGAFIAISRVSSRLWLGEDHLLQVESTGGYSESYKRFYFRDIQSIYLQKTSTWQVINYVLGIIAGLLLLWLVTVKDPAGRIALGIATSVFGFFLLVNLFHGSTCICQLKTAVHLEELSSLKRRRNAEKVLARIKPLIEAAQGSATAETIASQYAGLLASVNAMPATPGQFSRLADPTLSSYRSRAHEVLCFALLAGVVADTLTIFFPCVPVVLLNMITGCTVAGAVLIALVKQHQTDLKPALRVLTWVIAGFVAISYIISYVIMIVVTAGHDLDGTQWGYIKAVAALRPFEKPWLLGDLSITAALAGVFGTVGLLLLHQHRREKETTA
jgi:hypothetical protein